MRRTLLLVLISAVGVAGCGSSSSPNSAGSLNTELSYFPANSPFVMSVVTDPNSAAVHQGQGLVRRFPLATFGESALIAKLQQAGIDYQSDVRPLFGNPIELGLAGTALGANASSEFLAVWVTKDGSKLSALAKKLFPKAQTSTHGGATLYQAGSSIFAIDGATLLISSSMATVTGALDRHAHGGGISPSVYASTVNGLSPNALMEAFGNLQGVLSTPSAAQARRVPWIAALRGYAVAISATSSGLTFQYRLDTTGAPLTSAEIPIASGSSPPSLTNNLPITFGLSDPAHLVAFVEGAEQAAGSPKYAAFLKRQAKLRRKTGVDLNSLLKLLTGSLIVSSDTHTTLARAALSDPVKGQSTLAKLAADPHGLFPNARSVTKLPGGFYAVKETKQTITIGVAAGQLVLGKATPSQLRAFAAALSSPAAGAQGTVAFRIGLASLLQIALKHAPSKVVQTILSALGDVTGWTSASPAALTGEATLAVK